MQIKIDNFFVIDLTTDIAGYYYPPPKNKKVNISDCESELKFCITCKFYRPPRVVHCSTCNCCVERFDHVNMLFLNKKNLI